MSICRNCGAEINVTDANCSSCGSSLNNDGTEYFVRHTASQQTLGPVTEKTIEEWISQKQIAPSDLIAEKGSDNWTPLLQSPFGKLAVNQITTERLIATTCPRCGSAMVAVIKRSGCGLALILSGIALTPVLVGIPIFIVGMIIRHGKKGDTYLSCPRCNYSTA